MPVLKSIIGVSHLAREFMSDDDIYCFADAQHRRNSIESCQDEICHERATLKSIIGFFTWRVNLPG